MENDKIAEIRARLNAISISPWAVTHYAGGMSFDGPPSVYIPGMDKDGYPVKIAECNHEDDALFIANAPVDIKILLDEIDTLRARVVELETEVKREITEVYVVRKDIDHILIDHPPCDALGGRAWVVYDVATRRQVAWSQLGRDDALKHARLVLAKYGSSMVINETLSMSEAHE